MRILTALIIAIAALAESAAAHEPSGAMPVRSMAADKAVLVYERVDQKSIKVTVASQDRVQQLALAAPESVVDRLVSRMLDGLSIDPGAVVSAADLPEFDADAAHTLFKLLVQPLTGTLDGIDRLAIAADGDLARLPFDALLTDLPSTDLRAAQAYAAYPWLRTRFVISRVAGTDRPVSGRQRASRMRGGLLGFGNPAMPADAATPLPALPEANLELALLRLSLHGRPGRIAVGASASEARFKEALTSVDHLAVLALATHGSRVAGRKDDAVLMLSDGDGEDGLLTAEEVRALRFRADLVILSACDSGADALVDAFIEAGGDQVLALRWPVLSDVARRISSNVVAMTQSDADLPHDQALWRAVDRLISGGTSSHYAHPVIWAPFVLTAAFA